MNKAEREQRFDGILFSLAEQHPKGVLDVRTKKVACHFPKVTHFDFLSLQAAGDNRWLPRPQDRLLHWRRRQRMGEGKNIRG